MLCTTLPSDGTESVRTSQHGTALAIKKFQLSHRVGAACSQSTHQAPNHFPKQQHKGWVPRGSTSTPPSGWDHPLQGCSSEPYLHPRRPFPTTYTQNKLLWHSSRRRSCKSSAHPCRKLCSGGSEFSLPFKSFSSPFLLPTPTHSAIFIIATDFLISST